MPVTARQAAWQSDSGFFTPSRFSVGPLLAGCSFAQAPPPGAWPSQSSAVGHMICSVFQVAAVHQRTVHQEAGGGRGKLPLITASRPSPR